MRRLNLRLRRAAARLGLRHPSPLPLDRRFRSIADSTPAQWAAITEADAAYGQGLADRLLAMAPLLAGEPHGFAIDRLQHGLQTATRALRGGEDEEYVVCALLHDFGALLAPNRHGELAALILEPYVSEANAWMIRHHDVFQGYYFFHHLGHDRHARERFAGHPHYQRTARFCQLYDQAAFDPAYPTLPMEAFAPMLRRVLTRRRR